MLSYMHLYISSNVIVNDDFTRSNIRILP